jgi:uncharacterized protein (TIGR00299 family) protein
MIRLTTLYFDLFSGAAGDMILGALIDAGVPLADVRRALGTLAIDPDMVWTERVTRAGVTATKFCVRGEDAHAHDREPLGLRHAHAHEHAHDHAHDHDHDHGDGQDQEPPSRTYEHPQGGRHHAQEADASRRPVPAPGHMSPAGQPHAHRTLAEITALIDGSGLSPEGRARARHLFRRLGEAEAAVHGTTLDRVHLHEVGAIDSIIDIVGTVFAIEAIGADRIVASPVNVGGGMIRSTHGIYPVPAPATLRLLEGAPVYAGPQQVELLTPTGALLITDYASAFGPMPPMRVRASGYGAGARDLPNTPNVARVILGEAADGGGAHVVLVIEAEIDDMNPQIFGVLIDRLLEQGAYDVFYTAVQMKKNRPGTLLTVLAPPADRERLTTTIFRETTTLGVRYREMQRECLARERIDVETPLGTVRIKVARRDGIVMNASPEFDDCARLAAEHGRPIKDVQALANKAFLERVTAL